MQDGKTLMLYEQKVFVMLKTIVEQRPNFFRPFGQIMSLQKLADLCRHGLYFG